MNTYFSVWENDNTPLSNVFQVKIIYDGKEYPSSEHLYQSLKYINICPEYAEIIRKIRTPHAAKLLGNQWFSTSRKKIAWRVTIDEIICKFQREGLKKPPENINLMRIALTEKFTQDETCRNYLLSITGSVEFYGWNDTFWSIIPFAAVAGRGINAWRDDVGDNHLGKLLTELRDKFKI
jgi:ribA/ribD-fused uncharacterized protein